MRKLGPIIAISAIGYMVGAQPTQWKYPPDVLHRKAVFETLKTGKSPGGTQLNEDHIAEVAYWFEKGDRGALDPLLRATAYSDGAVSEMLGLTLGEILLKQPRLILKAASTFPERTQRRMGEAAIVADGSGWGPDDMRTIRRILKQFSKSPDPAIARTATLWLDEFDLFNKSLKE